MLGNAHYYHQLTRKAVVLFGRLFDDISIIRTNDQTGAEVNRFVVPIIYSPKEKMVTRVFSDPDLTRQLQAILPRMSFEITGITYDSARKQNSLLKSASPLPGGHTGSSAYMGIPYDLNFQLNVYARNIDDGTHIVEQILPFFNPDFTVSASMVPDLGFAKDIPVILNNVTNSIEYEGNYDSVRYVYWTLNFTMKLHYYGPVTTPKIIRTVYANIHSDDNLGPTYITNLTLANTSGTFKVEDTVFQGSSLNYAEAQGIVSHYNPDSNTITIAATQGNFKVNNTIHAVSTNGVAQIETIITRQTKTVEIKIEPDPITANPGDDYGYTTTITEWPENAI
jgi:T4-like virus Myoviridae tail sheath stabiliser